MAFPQDMMARRSAGVIAHYGSRGEHRAMAFKTGAHIFMTPRVQASYGFAAAALASCAFAVPAGATSAPYLGVPIYSAYVGVGGDYPYTDPPIYQDITPGSAPYDSHHFSEASPATWSVKGLTYRDAGGSEVQAYSSSATASTSNDHNGTVSVAVSTDLLDATATAMITYRFTIIGPDAAFIPITIACHVQTGAHNPESIYAYSKAGFQLDYIDAAHGNVSTHIKDDYGNDVNKDFSYTIDVKPNLDYAHGASILTLSAAAVVGNYACIPDIQYNCRGAGFATIDPVFSIADPALASLYTIVGIDGRALSGPGGESPPAAVPEPASWAMMVGGFGLIGSAMRRRRTRVCFA